VIEYRIRDLRGRWMWVRDHLTLVRDGSGAPLQIVGVVVDVTEDRSFALTLRREHSQLAQLLEMMPVGVVVVDARTRRILIGQRAVAALVGEIRTDLFAQDLERYGGYWPGTDDELGLLDWPLNRTLRTGESVHDVNAEVRRADGTRVTVSMSTTPVTDPDGSVVAVAMAFLDVTERTAIQRRTELALEAERVARSMIESLQRLSFELAAVTTTAEFDAAMMGPVLRAVGAHQTWVGALGADDVMHILLSNVDGFSVDTRLPRDTPVPGCEVVRTGVPLWIASGHEAVRQWPALRAFVSAHDDAIAALPLRQGGETFGCLVLRWKSPFVIEASLRTMLMALAEVAAQAVKRVQLLEHERAVARALQDSMMLQHLPVLDGVEIAALYEPAAGDLEVGGDWYDVIALPDGRIGVAVGDVMGRGLRAATAMGQLRSGLAALAGSFDDPATVLERLDHFAARVDGAWLASVFYGVIDPGARTLTFCSAGHVPPLLADGAGVRALRDGRSGLLGGPDPGQRISAVHDLAPGSLLLMYTDGLIETRGSDIETDVARLAARVGELQAEASGTPMALDRLCSTLAADTPEASDDVALLVVQLAPGDHISSFHGTASGAVELKPLRSALRQWLARLDLDEDTQYDVLLAAGEACANSVEHAYGSGDGPVELVGTVHHGAIELTISDRGAWIGPPSEAQRGQGLLLMRSLVDGVTVRATGSGTVVALTKHLRSTPA
ncbi:MAG: putative sensor protein, partial [Pseudonocardiales bacterium]|nr:putative sensor protein [Pseudonocardiales bacterium]